ncbi:hypothetical protein DFJ43DRAFT_1102926 [Lentinula guzmanii]|uniref:Uncharacterized protein n=1 Tax=Lentinula guzmanii TaxID=2804957 RepID=A0AA38J2X9_9AGAR|nr:hypothetical protein DFJ43DRAFT_1102926 [Lentinula guzmanii]
MLHLPSHLFAIFVIFTVFHRVTSSPLTITPGNSNSSYEQLEQRGDPRLKNVPIRLMRKNKEGSIIRPDTKVTADEDWALFLGIDGFQAHSGPSGTLTASRVEEPRTVGGTLVKLQDLGEKASFTSAEEKAKVFRGLLTEVPALHKGVGVPQTNLAYLNGIFAYLASSTVKAVATTNPPEAWVQLYNEMHAAKGDAS